MSAIATKRKSELASSEKVEKVTQFADDLKAQSIVSLDVRKKTSIADYFVICTGTSDTHIRAIAENVIDEMREQEREKPLRSSGIEAGTGWVLLDYGDVVFHAMSEEKRQFYDLESLWESASTDPSLS